jgi:hypothetical protein
MVKVVSIKREQEKAIVVLFADAQSDVTSGADIEGLPEGTELSYGSMAYTASGDVGFLKSDGTWSWV